jgi:hypothetical protein
MPLGNRPAAAAVAYPGVALTGSKNDGYGFRRQSIGKMNNVDGQETMAVDRRVPPLNISKPPKRAIPGPQERSGRKGK